MLMNAELTCPELQMFLACFSLYSMISCILYGRSFMFMHMCQIINVFYIILFDEDNEQPLWALNWSLLKHFGALENFTIKFLIQNMYWNTLEKEHNFSRFIKLCSLLVTI